jgi:SEC-C motif
VDCPDLPAEGAAQFGKVRDRAKANRTIQRNRRRVERQLCTPERPAKLKFPHLKKTIGIAIDAPKYASTNSEDFILMDCENWTDEQRVHYEIANKEFRFFKTDALKERRVRVTDFPTSRAKRMDQRPGRNQLCSCGSGKKFKRCHGSNV